MDEDFCLEDHYKYYSEAVTDMYGIQNTMNLATHTHKKIIGLEINPALKALNHNPEAPAGTSGWFLPSLGQWDLFLQHFYDPDDLQTVNEEPDADDMNDFAASVKIPDGLSALGEAFEEAGYSNPFEKVDYFYDQYGGYYGLWTSTESDYTDVHYSQHDILDPDDDPLDYGRAWAILMETDADDTLSIAFAREGKETGYRILPFLAF